MTDEMIELGNYIGGTFRPSQCNHWIDDFAPANGEQIGRIPCSDESDVNAAVDAAQNALKNWSELSM